MRGARTWFLALSLAATGCSFSSVDPDATITISGRALDAAGDPLSGARVLLFKEADLGEVVFGTIFTIGSLGTLCVLPDPPAICREARAATADDAGRFEFQLDGSDTQGSLGSESTLNVVFSGPEARGSTAVSFTVEDTQVALPDARLWRSKIRVSESQGDTALAWTPLSQEAGSDVSYSVQLFERDGTVLWSQPAAGTRASIDPRVLEDRSGSVAVAANVEMPGGSGTGEVRAAFASEQRRLATGRGAPPSRGRPCAALTGTSRPATGALSSCAATDGDLTSPARLRADQPGAVTGVVVDLGTARRVSLVVARGFVGQLLLELSDDGRRYRAVVTSGSPAVDVPGAPPARFVRVRSPAGLDESLVSELSVW